MAADPKQVLARYERLVNDRRPRDAIWDRLAPFVAPSRAGIQSELQPGVEITRDVYDSSAKFCAGILAKFVSGAVTNAASRWFRYKHGLEFLNVQDEVREWLDECTDQSHAALNRSNFYTEVYQHYVDWCGFGTGSMLAQELPLREQVRRRVANGLLFESHKIGRYVIAEDATGKINTRMQEFPYTANQAKERWGEKKLPQTMRDALAEGKGDKLYSIVHAVYPREEGVGKSYSGALGMPWASCFVEKTSRELIAEGGFEQFPGMVTRWEKVPGWVYGIGPGEDVFPDIKTLNAAKRMGFEDWALKIRPPILHAHDAVLGTLNLVPAGAMPVRTAGRSIGDLLQAFQTGSHPEVSQIKEEEIRRQIRQAFFVDQILAMLEVQKPEMTAYEFAQKMQLLYQLLSPIYGQLLADFLNPFVDLVFSILYRQQVFSDPPDILFDYADGGQIDVEFDSPLARAQKAEDVNAMQMSLADLAPIAKMQFELTGSSEIMDKIDSDKWADKIFNTRGVPASVIRSEKEIAAIREGRAQAKQAQSQDAALMGIAEGMGKAAPMVKAIEDQRRAA